MAPLNARTEQVVVHLEDNFLMHVSFLCDPFEFGLKTAGLLGLGFFVPSKFTSTRLVVMLHPR